MPDSADMRGQLRPLCAMKTSNLHKAAVFLRCLPEEQVALLLNKLTPQQALAVSAEMAGLREIDPEEQEAVAVEFAEATSLMMELEGNSSDEVDPSSKGDLPSEAKRFEFLWDLGAKELATLLGNEHPQTTALILSHLPAQRAAETLAALPSERQSSVVRRIASMNRPSREIIADVEQYVQDRLNGANVREARGVAGVVKMLSSMRPRPNANCSRRSAEPTRTCSMIFAKPCSAPTLPQLASNSISRLNVPLFETSSAETVVHC
jgi:flagellar motor switch protein FliG